MEFLPAARVLEPAAPVLGSEVVTVSVPETDNVYQHIVQYVAREHKEKVVLTISPNSPEACQVGIDLGSYTVRVPSEGGGKLRLHHEEVTVGEKKTEKVLKFLSQSFADTLTVISAALYAPDPYADLADAPADIANFGWGGTTWCRCMSTTVPRFAPSPSQQAVLDSAREFFARKKNDTVDAHVAYHQRMCVVGPPNTGKHWVMRQMAREQAKVLLTFEVFETTLEHFGTALATAPMGSLVVVEGLWEYFSKVPDQEYPDFFHMLDGLLKTPVHDPRGLMVVFLGPDLETELDAFLAQPHRAPLRFPVTLLDEQGRNTASEGVLKALLPDLDASTATAAADTVPPNMLRWWAATQEREREEAGELGTERSGEKALRAFCASVEEEQMALANAFDAFIGASSAAMPQMY